MSAAKVNGTNSNAAVDASTGASSTSTTTRPRILLVLGATGVGKSALGVTLAQQLNGEIISCDSIQSYEGMPIASNQLTTEEAHGVRHHAIGMVDGCTSTLTVHSFRKLAKSLIRDIHSRGRNVIIVGGTLYWIESILYRTLIHTNENSETGEVEEGEMPLPGKPNDPEMRAQPMKIPAAVEVWKEQLKEMKESEIKPVQFVYNVLESSIASSSASSSATSTTAPTTTASSSSSTSTSTFSSAASSFSSTSSPSPPQLSSAHLYTLLQYIDPPSAERIHPSNHRQLLRSLQIFVEHGGKTQSELLKETGGAKGKTSTGNNNNGGLQYDALAIWLDADTTTLNARLDARIDTMMKRGLLEEAEMMYKRLYKRQKQQQQQQQPLENGDTEMKEATFIYSSDLDPECKLCATVDARPLMFGASPASAAPTSTTASSSSSAAPSSTAFSSAEVSSFSSSSSDYLGPDPLAIDWERGIGQTLGLKEFRSYFKLKFHTLDGGLANDDVTVEQQQSATKKQKISKTKSIGASSISSSTASSLPPHLASCLIECLTSLKTRTRSYARIQWRWIKNRLWSEPRTSIRGEADSYLPILRLDATKIDAQSWQELIIKPALEVATKFLSEKNEDIDLTQYVHLSAKLPKVVTHVAPIIDDAMMVDATTASSSPADASSSTSSIAATASSSTNSWRKYRCDPCQQECNGSFEYQQHLQSKRHRTNITRDERKAKQMAQMEEVQKQRKDKRKHTSEGDATTATL